MEKRTAMLPTRLSKNHLASTLVLLALVAVFLPSSANAVTGGEDLVYTAVFSDLAVGGYDPVAFFTDGEPVKGNKKHEWQHRGATWRFASAANLAAFKKDPKKYSPQYGGYCAWAMANGDKAAGKAPYWKIVDDKLYLNYSASVQQKWLQDIDGFIAKADREWPRIATE